MNALVWNVRGFNHPSKQLEVRKQITKCKANVVCLVETRIREDKFQSISDKFLPGWGRAFCFSIQNLCRIWLLWKVEDISITVISTTSQYLHCSVSVLESKSDCYITFIYASNEGVDRRQLWLDMEDLQAMVDNSPWLLAGDFNVIKAPAEKFGGLALDTYEQDFKACTEAIGIEDHPAVGLLHLDQ
jgi:exonuclease III